MSNEFDPELKRQLAQRKRERANEKRSDVERARLKAYLQRKGLSTINDDESLRTITPKPDPLP